MKNFADKRIAFSEETLERRIRELGEQISKDYADKELVLVCVLKGSLYFFTDLTRAIDLPIQLDFISVGVYPNATSQTGVVRIIKDLDLDISGKHVLVIEDIVRTGLTVGYLVQNLESRMPASVKVCALLVNSRAAADQPARRVLRISGFEHLDDGLRHGR